MIFLPTKRFTRSKSDVYDVDWTFYDVSLKAEQRRQRTPHHLQFTIAEGRREAIIVVEFPYDQGFSPHFFGSEALKPSYAGPFDVFTYRFDHREGHYTVHVFDDPNYHHRCHLFVEMLTDGEKP